MNPQVKLITPNAQVPTRAHEHDAGWDLYSIHRAVIRPGETQPIHTGIAINVPVGQSGDIRPRSGLAQKGITVANAPGTIDPGFTGEVCVLLTNLGRQSHIVNQGDRIAQIVFTYINTQPLELVDHLTQSDRGTHGFGSTGQ